MKKIFFLLLLFFLCIVLTCVHAASPTYDDNPPPSYIWGDGGLNPQTSGTPNKNSDEKQVDILRDVNVHIGSITVDTGTIKTDVASLSSNLANAILSGSTVEQEISIDTSNIESYLKEVDGEETITITDLINGIGTDTKNIENKLKVDDKTVTELVNGIGTDTSNIDNKLKVDNKTVTELVNGIGTDTKSIKSNVSSIQSSVSTIQSDISGIQSDTDSIDNQTYNIANAVKHIDSHSVVVHWATSRKSIEPNTLTNLGNLSASISGGSNPDSSRVCLEIRAIDTDNEFYIGFDSNITDSTARPVKGRILLNINKNQNVFILHTNNSAMAIQQTEGWAGQL